MNFQSTPVARLGDYEVRRVHGSVWHGQHVVIRTTDQDVLSVHGSQRGALAAAADLDSGVTTVAPRAERLALLADVPTSSLTAYLATLDPIADWRIVRDLKAALAAR